MSWYENDESEYSEYCEAVRVGRDGKVAEVTIFYTTRNEEFQVHNDYLAETNLGTNQGRSYQRLKIITSRGKIIFVRRYDDKGEFVVTTAGYWLNQVDVEV